MLLTDAVHAIETIYGVWLGMSALAFIILGLVVKRTQKRDVVDQQRPTAKSRVSPARELVSS